MDTDASGGDCLDAVFRADFAARSGAPFLACEIERFEQVWGDRGLGFGGLHEKTPTVAVTRVVRASGGSAAVYVANRLAYLVKEPNGQFQDDLDHRFLLPAVHYVGQYECRPHRTRRDTFVVADVPGRLIGHAAALHRARTIANRRLDRGDPTPVELLRERDRTLIARFSPIVRAGRIEAHFTPVAGEYTSDVRHPVVIGADQERFCA